MRYKFLFAIVRRQPVRGEYQRMPDGTLVPVNRDQMYENAMSTAYYEKMSDGRVLQTSEHTAKLNACAAQRDYSPLDAA
jgi:hypothetical protein